MVVLRAKGECSVFVASSVVVACGQRWPVAARGPSHPSFRYSGSDDSAMNSLIVITGASRGIGRSIALSIADVSLQKSDGDIHMILISRSAEKLDETAKLLEEKCCGNKDDSETTRITTSCHGVDLSNLDTLPNELEHLFNPLMQSKYKHCWLFNNAGSVEPIGATPSLADGSMDELRNAIDLNITSSMWLSSVFTKTFTSPLDATSIRIVNISSLCAIEPFPTMAVYCAGKAARDMFHAVLAKELSESEKGQDREDEKKLFKVISYAPGACDTEMTDVLANCSSLDSGLHDYFSSAKAEKALIDPTDSARKLVELLLKDEYVSGLHVDYWDI